MATDANIRAVISAKDDASGVLKRFGDNASTIGNKIGDVARVAGAALLATGAAATAFGVASVKAYSESQDAQAQLQAVLESTHSAAGLLIEDLNDQAKALQKLTKFSDEQINSGQALLLTFTDLKGPVVQQATETILDMSTALGQDLKSSAIQLGKALQDPVLGITALRRVGVNFSDAQKDVIAKLVETGQKAKAQQLILKELNTEFGGSAIAAGRTFSGSLIRLKNSFNDLQESVGEAIVSAIVPFVQKLADLANKINITQIIDDVRIALRLLWDTLTGGDPAIREGEERFKKFSITLQNLRANFFRVYDAIIGVYQSVEKYLQPKLEALWHTLEDRVVPTLFRLWDEVLKPLIPVIGALFVGAIGLAIDSLNLLLTVITPVINFMLDNKTAVIALATAFGVLAIALNIGSLITAVVTAFGTIVTLFTVTIPAAAVTASAAIIAALPVIAVAAAAAAIVASVMTIKDAWDAVNNASRSSSNLGNGVDVKGMQQQARAAYAAGDTKKGDALTEAIRVAYGGVRARGGPVNAGEAYTVGESGRELFVPNQSGTILANDRMGNMGSNINISINVGTYAGSQMELRKLATKLQGALMDAKSMGIA